MQYFHEAYRVSNSSNLSVIITKSSTCHISQARVLLHSLKRASRTINNKGLKKKNSDEPLSLHQTDHIVAVPIHCHYSPHQPFITPIFLMDHLITSINIAYIVLLPGITRNWMASLSTTSQIFCAITLSKIFIVCYNNFNPLYS